MMMFLDGRGAGGCCLLGRPSYFFFWKVEMTKKPIYSSVYILHIKIEHFIFVCLHRIRIRISVINFNGSSCTRNYCSLIFLKWHQKTILLNINYFVIFLVSYTKEFLMKWLTGKRRSFGKINIFFGYHFIFGFFLYTTFCMNTVGANNCGEGGG